MYVLSSHPFALQGRRRAGLHRYVGSVGQLKYFADVAGCQVKRHVARYCRNAQHVQLWRRQRQQNRHGVILAWVGVDDDVAAGGGKGDEGGEDSKDSKAEAVQIIVAMNKEAAYARFYWSKHLKRS